jgi:STE24 endopeptidase
MRSYTRIMASEDGLAATAAHSLFPASEKARTYTRIKLISGLAASSLSFLLLLVAYGYTREIESIARSVSDSDYLTLIIFACIIGIVESAVTLPLGYYSGYHVEHRYGLSTQSMGRWAWERLKGFLVTLPIASGLLLFLYYCLRTYADWWWLPVSIAIAILSVVLARFAPVVIFPLFYKFKPIEEESLKGRILDLCSTARVHVDGIFTFNMSKNTKKVNAGFTGIGKARRIILGDTLVQEFSEEEIETVFAHELGHYKHRHIVIGILTGMVSTFAGLFVVAHLYAWSLALFGFTSLTQIAALPLLALWLALFGLVTTPIGNLLSRRHEHQADAYAVTQTGNRKAYISALQKLARTNLADPEPHPFIEFLFHSHPSIARRIRTIESLSIP